MADSVSNKPLLNRRPQTAHVIHTLPVKPPLFPTTSSPSTLSALSVQSLHKDTPQESGISAQAARMSHDEAKVFVKPRIFSAGPRSMISAITGSNPSRNRNPSLEDNAGVRLSGTRMDVPLTKSAEGATTEPAVRMKTPSLSRSGSGSARPSFSTIANEATLFPRPKSAAPPSPRPCRSARPSRPTMLPEQSNTFYTQPRSIVKATLSKWKSFNLNKSQHGAQFQSSFYESTSAILSKALPISSFNTHCIPPVNNTTTMERHSLELLIKNPGGNVLYHRNDTASEFPVGPPRPVHSKKPMKKPSGILESSSYKLTKAIQERQPPLPSEPLPQRDYININPFLLQMNDLALERRESMRSVHSESLEPVKRPVPPSSTLTLQAKEKAPHSQPTLMDTGKPSTFVPINLSERKVMEAKKCRLPISLQTDFSFLRKYERKGSKPWDSAYPFSNPLHQFDKYKLRIQNSANSAVATSSDAFFARVLEMERIEALTIETEQREKRKPRLVKSSYKRGVEAQASNTDLVTPSDPKQSEPVDQATAVEEHVEALDSLESQELIKMVQQVAVQPLPKCPSQCSDEFDEPVDAEDSVPLAPSAENEYVKMIHDDHDLQEVFRNSFARHRFIVLPDAQLDASYGQYARPPTPTHVDSRVTLLTSEMDDETLDSPVVSLKPRRKPRAKKSALKVSRKSGLASRQGKSKPKRSSALRPKSSKRKLLGDILPLVLKSRDSDPTPLERRSINISKIYLAKVDLPATKPIKIGMKRSSKRMIKAVR